MSEPTPDQSAHASDEPQSRRKPATLSYLTPPAVDGRWTTVWTAETLQEAHLAVGRLQSHGVHARIDGENASPLGGIMGPSTLLHPRVQVLRDDVETARELLMDVERNRSRRREALVVRCAKCGTPARQMPHPLRRLGIAVLIVFVIVMVVSMAMEMMTPLIAAAFLLVPLGLALLVWSVRQRWMCPTCGARWSQRQPNEDDLDEEQEDEEEDDGDTDEDKNDTEDDEDDSVSSTS